MISPGARISSEAKISPESKAAALPQGPDLKCGTSVPRNGFAALKWRGKETGILFKVLSTVAA